VRGLREFGRNLPTEDSGGSVYSIEPSVGRLAPPTGVQVGYDRRWLWLYSIRDLIGGAEFTRLESRLRPFEYPIAHPPVPEMIDDAWRPAIWDAMNDGRQISPYVVEVLRQRTARRFMTRRRTDAASRFTEFVEPRAWPSQPPGLAATVRVVHEVRPPSTLQRTTRGEKVWQAEPNSGSAGGVLRFPQLGPCTTTAGHVAPGVSRPVYVTRNGRRHEIGTCRRVPDYTVPWLSDETALVEMTDAADWPQLAAATTTIEPDELGVGRRVDVRGARTGHGDVFPYSYVQYRDFTAGDLMVRIQDGFELRRHSRGLFGLAAGFRQPTLPGDSGAWVLRVHGEGMAWAGTVVGGDSVSTVATFSKNTISILAAEFGQPTLA